MKGKTNIHIDIKNISCEIFTNQKRDYRFQADENGLLIATDVAARGLDIPNIEHVIHYQVPRTSEVNI